MKKTIFRQKGSIILPAYAIVFFVMLAGLAMLQASDLRVRQYRRQENDVKTTQLCEAGAQVFLRSYWRPFKTGQTFSTMDTACSGATIDNPMGAISGQVQTGQYYSAGVISYTTPSTDSYSRVMVVRIVGWIDLDGDGVPDANEPQKTVDVTVTFQLARSKVFDYTYFVNNYGWMDGFGPTQLIVNGDMRANGDFNFTNGSPTVNGSVYAAFNSSLTPAAAGHINMPPVKWSNSTYAANQVASDPNAADNENRWRASYDATKFGVKGTSTYETYRDLIFDSSAAVVGDHASGAVVADANGIKAWSSTSAGSYSTTTLDTTPTQQVVMPDLSNIGSVSDTANANGSYVAKSKAYVDSKATYLDGTANPNYNQGAFLNVWNTSLNSGAGGYQTLSTSGVINGSATVVGTASHPIVIHGPVTATQDIIIKGYVSGQGTIYTGRNVHIVGSIIYTTKPNFQGVNPTTVQQANEKADLLALAARGAIIMGDTHQFGSTPLQYMKPPFTHGRYDDSGNYIAAYDATATDSTGAKLYQPAAAASGGDGFMDSLSSPLNQIDAIMYTNFVGGGLIGSGNGCTINGSIISRDEAMVALGLPMKENYDERIRETNLNSKPVIDLQLPRSPVMIRCGWIERSFSNGS